MVLILFALSSETKSPWSILYMTVSLYAHTCLFSHMKHNIRVPHLTVRFHGTLMNLSFLHITYTQDNNYGHVYSYAVHFFSLRLSLFLWFFSFFMRPLFDTPYASTKYICMILMDPAVEYTWKWMFLVVIRHLWNQRYVMALDKIFWNNLPWKRRKIKQQDRNDRRSHSRDVEGMKWLIVNIKHKNV